MMWHKAHKEQSSPAQQAPIFGHGNEEEVRAQFIGLDTPRSKACKLLGVQGKANKRMENERRKLDAGSFTIAKKNLEGVRDKKDKDGVDWKNCKIDAWVNN